MYIVLSHESCDLDSVVSTLAVAYLRFKNRGRLEHSFLPVLNMMRRDYPTKTEVCFLLDQHRITPDCHLVFRDDVPECLLLRCRFILVNHHVSPFHYCVEEVYDYRTFQSEAARLPIYCQRIMHPMRSCAALITECYASTRYNYARAYCPMVLDLLHAAILMQNHNFVQIPKSTLRNVRDYQMMQFLEKHLGKLRPRHRATLCKTLVKILFDLSALTLPQILRREFKILRATNGLRLVRIAQCCFPMAVTRFISYEFAQMALQEFAAEHDCDYIILLGTSMHPRGGGLGIKELGLIPLDGLHDVEGRRIFEHLIINLTAAVNPLLSLKPHCHLDFMQGAFFFLNVWNIGFYDVLQLMQQILYDWVSEDIF
ncbi:uncharacterized protein Dwil_GK25312 [Drosophila willistoni]|uniref:Uncharacterized protein n=2 Tax=Drosophila willistoni TaxID=7260 RepID=B4NED7_DROWI|nr:uncharacterized protein Dwil_GK25312 [Drosophila willistoni]